MLKMTCVTRSRRCVGTSNMWIMLTVLLAFIATLPGAEGSAKVVIRFKDYENPGSVLEDGTCCDGEQRSANCTQGCDYVISVCVGEQYGSPCSLASVTLGGLNVQDPEFTFPASFPDGHSNPALINVNTWPGSTLVTVTVSDQDTSGSQRVDVLQFWYNLTSPARGRSPNLTFTPFSLTGNRSNNPSRMTVEVTARCDLHFYGDSCDANCVLSDDCNGHYTCNLVTGERVCNAGWGGGACNQPLSSDLGCPNALCTNHGACIPNQNYNLTESYYCCCSEGYVGDNCEIDKNECSSSPCLNGGQCIEETPPNYRCQCPGRYTGKSCEVSRTCADNPCQNGGACIPFQIAGTTSFYCICNTIQFTGDVCEVPVTTTTVSPPTTSAVPRRKCLGNYYGADCLTYCRPADDCSGHYSCDPVSGRRVCLPGWTRESSCTVRAVIDPSCACLNGGQCFQGECCCPTDFTGPRCEQRAFYCPQIQCQNGGTCFEGISGFRCSCPEMFTGEVCETMLYPNRNCPQYYYGPRCDVFCQESFDCGVSNGTYNCHELTGRKVCMFGWLGPDCDVRDPAAVHSVPCPRSTCRNGGMCLNTTCCCAPGYTGSLCHVEILECESSPCLNGGTCSDLINGYLCTCGPVFSGYNCEEDLSKPFGGSISNVSTTPYPVDNPCMLASCLNQGTCVDNGKSDYICICSGRSYGKNCEKSAQTSPSNPLCPANRYGNDCSVTCIEENSTKGHYFCNSEDGTHICMSGWAGDNCTERTVPVNVDPECPIRGTGCRNNGTCFNRTCVCPYPYAGSVCQEERLACSSSPCGQFGVCLDIASGYMCQCIAGYSGKSCEVRVEGVDMDTTWLSWSQPGFSGASATGVTSGKTDSAASRSSQEAMTAFVDASGSNAVPASASLTATDSMMMIQPTAVPASGSTLGGATITAAVAASALPSTTATVSVGSMGDGIIQSSSSNSSIAGDSKDLVYGTTIPVLAASTMTYFSGVTGLSESTASVHGSNLNSFTSSSRLSTDATVSGGLSAWVPTSALHHFSASHGSMSAGLADGYVPPATPLLATVTVNVLSFNLDEQSTVKSNSNNLNSQPSVTMNSGLSQKSDDFQPLSHHVDSMTPSAQTVEVNGMTPTVQHLSSNIAGSTNEYIIPGQGFTYTNTPGHIESATALWTVSNSQPSAGHDFQSESHTGYMSAAPNTMVSIEPTMNSGWTYESSMYTTTSTQTMMVVQCGSLVCYNGGTCQSSPAGDSCSCPRANMGKFCEIVPGQGFTYTNTPGHIESATALWTVSNSQPSDGHDFQSESDTGYMSAAPNTMVSMEPTMTSGWTYESSMYTTTSTQTMMVVQCGLLVCYNGGTCQSSPAGDSCSCPRANMGRFCELVNTATGETTVSFSYQSRVSRTLGIFDVTGSNGKTESTNVNAASLSLTGSASALLTPTIEPSNFNVDVGTLTTMGLSASGIWSMTDSLGLPLIRGPSDSTVSPTGTLLPLNTLSNSQISASLSRSVMDISDSLQVPYVPLGGDASGNSIFNPNVHAASQSYSLTITPTGSVMPTATSIVYSNIPTSSLYPISSGFGNGYPVVVPGPDNGSGSLISNTGLLTPSQTATAFLRTASLETSAISSNSGNLAGSVRQTVMDSSVTESQYRPIGLSHGSDVSLFSTVSQAIQSTSVLTGSDIITSSLMSSMTPAVYGSGAYHTGSSSPFGSATASGVSGSSLPLDSSRTATPTLQSYSPNVISSQTSVLPDVRTGQSTMSLFSVADGSIQDRSLSFTAYQGQSLQGSTVFPTSLTGFIPPATPLSMATTATVVPFMPLATSLVYQQSTAIPTLSTTSSVLATSTPTSSPLPPDQRLIRGELFITGPISHEDNTRLIDLIISSFNAPEQPGSSCCFIIVVDQSDKYFDNNWNSLIRIEYTFALLTGGIDPADTRNVMLTQLDRFLTTTSTFSINNNRVYRGYPHGPDVIFSLDVTGDVATATYPRMSVIIAESWATQNSGCGGCTFTSRIILGQRSAGRYGTRLTRLYYVVFKNGNLQLILSPEAPSINAIATSFSAHQDVYGLYMFDDVRSFSYHYEVLANSVVTLTSQRGRDAQYALRTQWQRYFNNSLCARTSCSIMLNYVRPELQYTDTNLAISNLAYFVTLNGNMVAPSSVVGPSQAEFGGIFTPCGCQHRGAHSLYVYGDVTYFTLRSLLNEVIQVNDGANIIARDFYYDIHRSLLTKVYFRTSSLDAVVPPQSSSSFQQVLGRYNLQTLEVGMPIRQKHRLVLEGVVGNQSIAQMMTALREAWASNSNEINVDDINVAIFKMDSESFVKQNGSRVTVVSYLVSVGQADGSLTIAEEPPVSSLALNFRQRFGDALAVCSCDVIKQHAITATGNLNPADGNQVDSVRKAIEEAWRDANKEYDGDIKVNIFSVTPGRVNASEPQSRDEERTVSFGVVLQNGTSGVTDLDLQPPRSTVLQTKFTDTGSEVAFVEEGVSNSGESDEFPWYIPVGVILALLLILVIIFVFICIFRDRRKDSKEIDNNPDDFRDDNYDKEHFTMEPVAFENEAFHNLEMASQTYVVNPDETDDAGPF